MAFHGTSLSTPQYRFKDDKTTTIPALPLTTPGVSRTGPGHLQSAPKTLADRLHEGFSRASPHLPILPPFQRSLKKFEEKSLLTEDIAGTKRVNPSNRKAINFYS